MIYLLFLGILFLLIMYNDFDILIKMKFKILLIIEYIVLFI